MQATIEELSNQVDARTSASMINLELELKSVKATVDEQTQRLEGEKQKNQQIAEGKRAYQIALEELERQKRLRDTVENKIKIEEIDKAIKRSTAVVVWDKAEAALKAAYPKMTLNLALGAFVGLVLGIGLAFFIEYLDTSVKTIDDVGRSKYGAKAASKPGAR